MVNLKAAKPVQRKRAFKIDPQADITGLPVYMNNRVNPNSDAKDEWSKAPNSLYFRSKVRTKSALCTYLVGHGLSRVDPESDYIKTKNVLPILFKHYSQIQWDPVSVGKILSDYVSAAELLNAEAIGWSEKLELPLQRWRNGAGYFYSMHPGPHTTAWLWTMLKFLHAEAVKERDDPTYWSTKGSWQKKGFSTPAYNAGYIVRNKLVELGKGPDGIYSVVPMWVFESAGVRYK